MKNARGLAAFVAIAVSSALAAGALADGVPRAIEDDFEHGLDKWSVTRPERIRAVPSGDAAHGQVMLLEPDGDDVLALAKGTEAWRGVRIEADVLFPTSESNYLGVAYNYQRRGTRSDFGLIYIKGNDSYVQANPHRDLNVGRTLYPEYTVPLTGARAIVTREWQRFRVEVVGTMCHFYVGDMTTPAMTFPHFEHGSGAIGLQPRSVGGPVWIDNVSIVEIDRLSHAGDQLRYETSGLLTSWEVAGPFAGTADEIARGTRAAWRPYATDARGAVVTGAITDFHGPNTVAYFRTSVPAQAASAGVLEFSTIDDLAVWVNGRFHWFVPRGSAAWFDFATNPKHAGQKIPIDLKAGENSIVIRVRGGAYATGGFYARLAPSS